MHMKSESQAGIYRVFTNILLFSSPWLFSTSHPQGSTGSKDPASPTLQATQELLQAPAVCALACLPGVGRACRVGCTVAWPHHRPWAPAQAQAGRPPPLPCLLRSFPLPALAPGQWLQVGPETANGQGLRHMKVCESLAVFDSPDLINLAFESSIRIQRAAKLKN